MSRSGWGSGEGGAGSVSEAACLRLCAALDLFQQAVALEQVLYELN